MGNDVLLARWEPALVSAIMSFPEPTRGFAASGARWPYPTDRMRLP